MLVTSLRDLYLSSTPRQFTDDFESVEVFNSPGKFCQNFQDWQGLLNQGSGDRDW